MQITVLNGSPKGNESVTMQYILYIQKKFPQHTLKIINISQQIKKIEKNQERFQEIINEIQASDGVIWGTPVYYCLVPSQYKRFIELITERNVEKVFKDKYGMALTTSIHYFDHTSHNYLRAISEDLGMKFVGGFSADSNDLMITEERERLIDFADNFFYNIKNKTPTSKHFSPLKYREFNYTPSSNISDEDKIAIDSTKILILTDSLDEKTNLGKMIKRFCMSFSEDIDAININDVDVKGGCLGCILCGYDNQCVYKEKDGFTDFWDEKVRKTDILIIAGSIRDRYLSSRWKIVFDRSFFNNHVPTLSGKQIGFIISGPLSQIPNLKQILSTYSESQKANFIDFITDEYGTSEEIDLLIQNFATNSIRLSNAKYIHTHTYLSKGGELLFRDEVSGRLKFVFRADDRYYEQHGLYDTFPQNNKAAQKMNDTLIPLIENNEDFRKQFYDRIKTEMVRPLKSIVEDPNK
ncbi:MAG: NAD(P)H-dependent oxidoreductase [Candidatus Thorarchaeota archaeon]